MLVAKRRLPLVCQPYEALAAAVGKQVAVLRVEVGAGDHLRQSKKQGGRGSGIRPDSAASACAASKAGCCGTPGSHQHRPAFQQPRARLCFPCPPLASVKSSMFCGLMSTMLKAWSCLQKQGGGGEPEAQKAQQAAQEERIPATSGCGQARSSVLIILYCLPEMLPILPAMHLPSMYAAPPRAQPAALSCRPAACSFGPPPV